MLKQISAAVIAMLFGFATSSNATDCTMTGSDGFGAHSFDTTGAWSPAIAPSAGNNYFSGAFIIRSNPTGTLTNQVFGGDSLTIQPGGALYQKVNPLWMTVNNLTNNGRVVNAQAGTFVVQGNMFIPTNSGGGAIDTGSGNTSGTDSRPIYVGSTLSGSGNLTNWTSDANWPNNSAAQGTVTYTANNSGFTGRQIALRNTIIAVSSQVNLGGNPSVFTPDQLTLNLGILRPLASFALTNSNGGITIGSSGGSFDIAAGIFLTNAQALAGSGTLTLTNSGTLVHQGSAASFTGTLSVQKGSFILDTAGSLAGANTISVGSAATFDATAAGLALANGQTLAGNGTITGNVSAGTGSKISPGGSGATANLSVTGDLNLTGGATLACDFLTTNDVVVVGGNLSASGITIIQPINVPAVGTYPLITVAGTLGGSAANFQINALTTRNRSYSIIYDTVSSPKRVLLQVTSAGSAANLTWVGDSLNNLWDINTSSDWLNGVSSDVYYDADNVNFTDAGASNQPVLNVTVNPGAVFFNSSSNYTLTGTGSIAGFASVTKSGVGTVTLSLTNNTYSLGTIISNGILQVGFGMTNTDRPLGSPGGSTPLVTVANTGTFNINGCALDSAYTSAVQINGNGFSATQGAVDNNQGGLTSGGGDVGIATLSLAGDSTVSAASNWQIGNTGSGIIGNGFTLTKIGNNYLYLKHAATSPLGKLVIAGGGVLFWDHGDAAGTTASIVLTNGGFIDTWNPANAFQGLTFASPLIVSGDGSIINYRQPYNHPASDIFNGSVALSGTLTFSNVSFVAANQYNNNTPSFGKTTMNGSITGTGGVIVEGGTLNFLGTGSPEFYGGNLVYFNGNNSYSGPTLVTNLVWLLTSTANQSGGSYDIVDSGALDVATAAGKPTIPMSSLTLEYQQFAMGPANLAFTRLAAMPTSPVVYATNLVIDGHGNGYGGVILPPTAGYSVGQFPLIKYEGSIGGDGFAGLALAPLPTGVAATLVDNSANHTIDLLVTAAGITWTGANSTNWDTGTANWYNPVSSSTTTYSDGQSVVFPDNATNYEVNITQPVQPAGITVDSTNNYRFTAAVGAGISGNGALIKKGSGTLIMAGTNNTFTGGTFIYGGTLMLSDSNFAYPYGGGALNNNLGNITIANGGTLDVNGVQVPNYQTFGPEGYNVFLSGSGVGGNGALVNNNTNNNDNADPGYVTLTGNATVGGAGDINIRHGVSPQLSSQSSAYTLTKVGAGQFRIRYVTSVSTNFGAINILQGNVTYESSSAFGLGDASKNIYIGNGAGFGWGTMAANCTRPLICSNNATIYGLNVASNIFTGPVTLDSGNVNLNANFYHGMIFSNVISGAGGITVQYQSYVTFAAANTYSGDTTVVDCGSAPGSILRLVGNGSIGNSPNITLLGVTASQAFAGALDASGRSDGTLTLNNGQTLRGDNGSYVKGNVLASSGATITPGGSGNVQYMTFSNNVTLNSGSVVAMDVNVDSGLTNDAIKVVGTMNYAGTLFLTNSGATALAGGQTFKLFSNGGYTGNMTVSGSPGAGLTWSFNPATGIATVNSSMATNPTNITFSVTGNALTLSWPSDHLGWTLQAQTNSLGTGLTTNNWFDVSGSSSSTQSVINIDPTAPAVFYRLRM
ncbi:MAG TPA: autotransporter-associated beta strand repeat-containing protein [Verrucomicrobiae bacterium]|nr:autotransporter-associated beta strand repeat-containing protein [Verrucomicrobiae bacterium]